MILMMQVGITDKFPWTDCFAKKDKKKSVEGDTTKDSHGHSHDHGAHGHSHAHWINVQICVDYVNIIAVKKLNLILK